MKTLSLILLLQGIYYLLTGLWAIISITSFSFFTQYPGDYFLKHTNALLFLVLGIFFIYSSQSQAMRRFGAFLAIITTLGVTIIEFFYLPKIGNPLPFRLDIIEEFTTSILLIIFLSKSNFDNQ